MTATPITAGNLGDTETRSVNRNDIWLILVAGLVGIVDGIDTQAVAFAAPFFKNEFGLSPSHLGIVFSAGLVGGLCGAIPAPFVESALGRRRSILLCILWFALGSAATALATSAPLLIAIRFLSGLGLGMAIPLLLATMADAVPAKICARALSVVTCAVPGGGLVIGLLAAWAIPPFGWRSLFWFGTVLPLLLIPLFINATRPRQFSTVFDRALVAQSGEGAWDRIKGAFNEGGMKLLILLFAAFCTMLLSFSLLSWLPSLLSASGKSPAVTSVAGGLLNGGAIAAIITIGYLLDHRGAKGVTIVCFALGALFVMLLGQTPAGDAGTFALTFIAGFFAVGSNIGIVFMVANSVSAPFRVAAITSTLVSSRVGAGIGPLVVGLLIEDGWSSADVLTYLACVSLVICVAVYVAHIEVRKSARSAA